MMQLLSLRLLANFPVNKGLVFGVEVIPSQYKQHFIQWFCLRSPTQKIKKIFTAQSFWGNFMSSQPAAKFLTGEAAPPKQKKFFWLIGLSQCNCFRDGGGISLLQERSCSFEPVLNVTLYQTICLMSRNSSRADCKGTEWWGCSGVKKKSVQFWSLGGLIFRRCEICLFFWL